MKTLISFITIFGAVLYSLAFAENSKLLEFSETYTTECDNVMNYHCSEFSESEIDSFFEKEYFGLYKQIQKKGGVPLKKSYSAEKKPMTLKVEVTLIFIYSLDKHIKYKIFSDKQLNGVELEQVSSDDIKVILTTVANKYIILTHIDNGKKFEDMVRCKDFEGIKRLFNGCGGAKRELELFSDETTQEVIKFNFSK